MSLSPGTRFGSYVVAEAIGAGGMGEVYRATDTKLQRDVAIKVLPAALADDAERLARFRREAEVLASLNHPNIAHIYGLEDGDGATALVMELINGPTLADRIANGPIDPDEALPIALQIAEALEAAHARGIVHRDLKPANIKIREDGLVKVLDFGIAKALDTHETDTGMRPAALTSATTSGSRRALGTAAYMSPEQARGKAVDGRTDIWSFGCVLYEMLTGQPAFGGEDETSTIARVLERETDMRALPSALEAPVRKALKLCLVKDARGRVADIRDVRLILAGTFEDEAPAAKVTGARLAVAAVVSAVVAAVIAGAAVWAIRPGAEANVESAAPAAVVRAHLNLAPGTHLSGGFPPDENSALTLTRPSRPAMDLSPDGSILAYTAHDGTDSHLYLQRLERDEPTLIAGSEGAGMPFFSPDGRSVGFWANGLRELKRLTIESGEIRSIAFEKNELLLPGASHASWTDDDTLLVMMADGIYEMPSTGGSMTRLTVNREAGHYDVYPDMLPGRRGILFNDADLSQVPSEWPIVVQPLDGGERRTLIEGGSAARYVATGHIVFARSGVLLAAPFDIDTLEITGAPAVVIEDVMQAENGGNSGLNSGAAHFSVADNGTLVVAPGGIYPDIGIVTFVWIDRNGNETGIDLPPASYLWPRVSPDGRLLSYAIGRFGDLQIWVYDLELEVPIALTSEGENNGPVWSPDSARLAYSRADLGNRMFTIAADGGGEPEPIGADLIGSPAAWSSNNILAFRYSPDPANAPPGLWTLRMDGVSEPEEFLTLDRGVAYPEFSPDGQWVAYVSIETGRAEVYVRPYPAGTPVYRISNAGGTSPIWSPDGTQLFYRQGLGDSGDMAAIMFVDVDTSDGFARSRPAELFRANMTDTVPLRSIDINPDGQRFVARQLGEPPDDQAVTSLNLVLNWFEELTERVPVP